MALVGPRKVSGTLSCEKAENYHIHGGRYIHLTSEWVLSKSMKRGKGAILYSVNSIKYDNMAVKR